MNISWSGEKTMQKIRILKNEAEKEEAVEKELYLLLALYGKASPDDQRVIWAILDKYR